VKHAGDGALARLEPLLVDLRNVPGLKETKLGVFYRGRRAFLHFHEDGTTLYADVHFSEDWERLPVGTAEERSELLRRIHST
jgi:hypothetical protein